MSDTINPSGAPQTPPDAPEPQAPFTPQDAYAPPTAPVAPVGAAPAPGAPVPPAGQVPPFQAQPPMQNVPGMPLFTLTGGMKFGWAVAGFFMGPIAILLAWLTNAHNFPEAKNAAVKFALFGFLAQFLAAILIFGLFGCAACAAVSSAASSGYYHYY